ncbi:MAG: AAA domain-containing protein, partial [Planctomycetia bacterium]
LLTTADAERLGLALGGLARVDEYSGLAGRRIVTFTRGRMSDPLPWTRLGVGSPVLAGADTDERRRRGGRPDRVERGVICEMDERFLRVAFPSYGDDPVAVDDVAVWRLDQADDEASLRRQRTALDRARHAAKGRLFDLRRVLLGERPAEFDAVVPRIDWLNKDLNESQRDAVRLALAARDVALLHGPPGTGKTTTVVELIRQAVRRGESVLACAPSNLAVDNMLERLVAGGEAAVRIGHPARVLPALRRHTLDVLVDEHDDVRLARKLSKEAYALFRQADRWTRGKPAPGEKRDQRQEARSLLADAKRLEAGAAAEILAKANIVCSTLTSVDADILGERFFDLVVIDEGCQSTEPACWIPLDRCRKVALAGDHCQLPPTVVSPEAQAGGLGVSLLERLAHTFGRPWLRRLDVQYRMNRRIMEFSSAEFYAGSLLADPSAADRLLTDAPAVAAAVEACSLEVLALMPGDPVHLIDTAGAGLDEEAEPEGESRRNRGEAELVRRRVLELLAVGVPPTDVAVITPYAGQVRFLRELLVDAKGVEIDTVDGFQGREKEVVVLSLVRSNAAGTIGFLSEVRRTNVAWTRAKRKLIVIGDTATLSHHAFYARMATYCEQTGGYHTVWEEPDGVPTT